MTGYHNDVHLIPVTIAFVIYRPKWMWWRFLSWVLRATPVSRAFSWEQIFLPQPNQPLPSPPMPMCKNLGLFPFQHSIFMAVSHLPLLPEFTSSGASRLIFSSQQLAWCLTWVVIEINSHYLVISESKMNWMGWILIAGWGRPASGSHFLPVDALSSCHSEVIEPHLVRVSVHFMCFHFSPQDPASVSNPQRKSSRWPHLQQSHFHLYHTLFPTSVWLLPWSANCDMFVSLLLFLVQVQIVSELICHHYYPIWLCHGAWQPDSLLIYTTQWLRNVGPRFDLWWAMAPGCS